MRRGRASGRGRVVGRCQVGVLTICHATSADGVQPEPTSEVENGTVEHELVPDATSQDGLLATHNPSGYADGDAAAIQAERERLAGTAACTG